MKFRQFAFFIILILLGVLVLKNAGKMGELLDLLKGMNLFVLVLILPVRFMYYWFNTRYYKHFFSLYGHTLSTKELFPAVVSMNFVNTVIPTGGISGATFFARTMEPKVDQKISLLAQSFWYLATFCSFVLLLVASFLVLFFSNAIAQASFRLILILISGVLFLAFCVFAISLNELVMRRALVILTTPVNWVLKLFRRAPIGETHIKQFVHSYHTLIELFRKHPKKAWRPLADAIGCVGVEIVSIMIVFLAIGQLVNPGVIGAGYVFAMIFSVLSVFTSGVGAYEATMVAVFVALGQSFEVSLSVTAVYRLIALWLFIPFGLIYYKRQTLDDKPE